MRGFDVPGVLVFVAGLTGLVFGLSRGGLNGWADPLTIGGIVVGVVLLPIFVLIERHHRAPMLDLSIFSNRLFAAATGAAFINGLSRFALMFLFVFYFQGVKGQDPITAGIELAPLAIGMLIASPLAGVWADRRGSRAMAAAGMAVSARRAGRDDDARRAHAVRLVGAVAVRRRGRLGHVQQPQHGGDDGRGADQPARDRGRRADDAAEHRRGDLDRVRAGDRYLLGRQGHAVRDLLGRHHGLSDATLDPFVSNMHVALWVLAATSVVGTGICLLRPRGD